MEMEVGATAETVEVTATASFPISTMRPSRQALAPKFCWNFPCCWAAGHAGLRTSSCSFRAPRTQAERPNPSGTRFNGGQHGGEEAVMDGVSMVEGTIGNNGMISFADLVVSPEMVDEVRVLTSNYEPQYGTTNSAHVIVNSRSGTSEYHGRLFEYHRNTVLNARQFGADERPKDIENNFGGSVGGPVPGLNRGEMKTFFFYLNEQFRIRGGVNRPTISIPFPSSSGLVISPTGWTARVT